MAPTLQDLQIAMAAYWQTLDDQLAAAEAIQSTAEGGAKAVRGGGHFNPIVNLISRFFLDAGYPEEAIGASGAKVTLPGFYRATKDWDLVVVHKGVLVAAVELKALGGPSFGNNYNNRLEEGIGNSADISQSHLTGLVGSEKPWLGYFFVMHDEPGSSRPVRLGNGPFPADEIWIGRSYQTRFEVTGQRLMDEGYYDALCYLVSSPGQPIREPVKSLDWRHFAAAIQARIKYLAELGYP